MRRSPRTRGSRIAPHTTCPLPLASNQLDCHLRYTPMFTRTRYRLRLPSRTLVLGERTLIMGILNITPDSFFAGGRYPDAQLAVEKAFEMEQQGADILDGGGESTRPGADPLTADEEIARV